ncbi:MAG: hypothetical protein LBG87_06710 [Spirochaetaceae bacterium]|jgi:uncharacterized protein with von Willebrand factor type A (vWA) domain|nr:hypothetical protein [Spirochaetaceae bacterium]
MRNKFHQFIHFGGIGDRGQRSRLAFALYDGLRLGSEVFLSDQSAGNFGTALTRLLEQDFLRKACAEKPELAEHITQDILDFINASQRNLLKTESPFEMEFRLLAEFEELTEWKELAEFEELAELEEKKLENTAKKKETAKKNTKNTKKPNAFGKKLNAFSRKQDAFGKKPNAFSRKPNAFGKKLNAFSRKQDAFGKKPNAFSRKQNAFGKKPNAFGKRQEAFRRKQDAFRKIQEVFRKKFKNAWEGVAPFIAETYSPDELDPIFYGGEFLKCLRVGRGRFRRSGFESVKAHFTERWRALLEGRQADWERDRIAEQGNEFRESLRRRVEEMQAMEELLSGNPLRLWNLTRGIFRRASFDVFGRYADRFRRDPLIRELADLLGRSRRDETDYEEAPEEDAQTEPEWLESYVSKSDLIGIRESGDLSSIVPSETVLLAEETAQFLFYQKFAEKKLQTFEYRHWASSFRTAGTQGIGRRRKELPKGPFILCIDTSGSMRGAPESVAKTFCFGLLKTALQEKRACYLISFAVAVETLQLTDLESSLDALIDFLSQSFYGGTDPMPVFQEALRLLETEAYRKADIIMVSDFFFPPLDDATRTRIQQAKENKTKFHSLLIGDQRDAAVNTVLLKEFDSNWVYDTDFYE